MRPRARLLVALLLAACAPTPPAVRGPSAAPSAAASRKPSPSPSPGASATPAGTPAPGATPTAGAASATPVPGLPTPTPDPRLARIELKLLRVAQLGFGQLRGRLASAGAFDGPGGAALIGNNGAGIISNNGSGIVSDHGGGYRLAQATPTPAPPTLPAITDQPQGAEKLVADRLYLDAVRLRTYTDPAVAAPLERTRVVASRAAGGPFFERRREVRALHASGKPSRGAIATVEILAGGRFGYTQAEVLELDEAGRVLRGTFEPGAYAVDLATGGVTHFEAFSYDSAARTAAFAFRYAAFGLTERGSLRNMRVGADGGISYNFWDPLEDDDGTSEVVDAAGQRLFARTRTLEGGQVKLGYDLGDGLTAGLVVGADGQATGRLEENGVAVADVVREGRADGSVVFVLTFDADKARPVTIGYGLPGGAAATPAPQPPRWSVVAIAGAAEAGHADAARGEARFDRPHALIGSKVSGKTLYVADGGNHRVRKLVATTTFEARAHAGGAEAGHADGPGAAARFETPYGLAIEPDDTLYVSDVDAHRIRVVAPDGAVTTLAGTGTPGFADGAPGVGTLGNPTGLALDPATGRLYVADLGNHAIRFVETRGAARGTIGTLVGGGPSSAGFADGAKAVARFDKPRGVALGPDGALYVADGLNRRIRRVALDGTVTTVAGSGAPTERLQDGPGLAAAFNAPRALGFGPDGTLYFTTPLDVQALVAGEVRSVAGSATRGQRDGVAGFATFAEADGLFVAPSGVLYVTDGNRIRAVRPPAAPAGP